MNKEVRTRFAPSPTGEPHIGNIRSALFAWLFARHNEGKFILRIEDTDKERYVGGSVEKIKESLEFLGMDYDEGIDKDGEYGPYLQSERLEIYKEHIQKLIDEDKAYYCFCSSDRLNKMREEQKASKFAPKYDRKCLNLSKEEIKEKLDNKESHVVRFKIPDGFTEFKDIVRGKVSIKNEVLDDQIILKSDGYPTYHLAVVVDDYLMKISHVIRAEEWLPSTPKHILLYQAFGWDIPAYAHLPMILGDDKKKLSKRHGAVSFLDYKKQGYLPEALVNFMVFLGWNPKDEREVFSTEELIKEFDLEKVNKAGAVFNIEKLNNINGHYIREMDISDLTKKCVQYLEKEYLEKKGDSWIIKETKEEVDAEYLEKIVLLEQERIKKLSEIGDLTGFFFKKELEYDSELLIWKKSNKEETLKNLKLLKKYLEKFDEKDWNKEKLEEKTIAWLKENDYGIGDFLWPMRVALSGEKNSPGPFEIAGVLGKEKTLNRIEKAINK